MKKMILKNLGKTDCHILLYDGSRVLINKGQSLELKDPYDKKYEEFFVPFRPLGIYLYTKNCENEKPVNELNPKPPVNELENEKPADESENEKPADETTNETTNETTDETTDETTEFVANLAKAIDESKVETAETLKKKNKAELKELLTKKNVSFSETASKDELIELLTH